MKISLPKLFLFFVLILICPSPADAEQSRVLVVNMEDTITNATYQIMNRAIQEAEEGNYDAMVVTIDTPGGALDATLNIMKAFNQAEIPIIGYVHPSGATAWSAGVFILSSCDLASMSPNTVLGSAQPVQITPSGQTHITEPKEINALVGRLKSEASSHDRNPTVYSEFILENLNLNETEALKNNVIELIAPDIRTLLNRADGMEVIPKGIVLNTENAGVVNYQPPINLSIAQVISNPIIASLLMTVGLFALVFGFSSPGFGAEIIGAILLIMGVIGSGFNISYGALALLVLGGILLVAELLTPAFGFIGGAGIFCIIMGGIFLVPLGYPEFYVPSSYANEIIVIFACIGIALAAFLIFAIYKIIKIREKRVVVGEIIGDTAITDDEMNEGEIGFVQYNGEYWKARARERIGKGQKVRILEKDGVVLVVEPLK